MIMFEIIMYALVLLGFIGCGVLVYRKEKRDWNKGVCPKCGGKLKQIGNDNMGYMCESCREYWVWFSLFRPKEL
jgi:hypothetical protein